MRKLSESRVKTTTETFEHEGATRKYLLSVPLDYDASKKYPLYFWLHGERLLRHRERMARIGRHHAGRKLDTWHFPPDDREHTHRVEGEDLGKGIARESIGLDGLGIRHDVVDGAGGGVAAEDSDLHGPGG